MAEEVNTFSKNNIVIPDNVLDRDKKTQDFISKYKNDYGTKKEYQIYEKMIDKNNSAEESKTKQVKSGVKFIIVSVLFWIRELMLLLKKQVLT